jgi:hypothetical protein
MRRGVACVSDAISPGPAVTLAGLDRIPWVCLLAAVTQQIRPC